MQRMFNLDKWTLLREGNLLGYPGVKVRNVKMEINAPSESALYVIQDNEPRFLALVKGRETVEFTIEGAFDLSVEGASVYVYTAEGAEIHATVLEPVVFTKIAERRRRNPELEWAQFMAQKNIDDRMSQLTAEMEARYAALYRQQNPAPVGGAGGQPAAGGASSEAAGTQPQATEPVAGAGE